MIVFLFVIEQGQCRFGARALVSRSTLINASRVLRLEGAYRDHVQVVALGQ